LANIYKCRPSSILSIEEEYTKYCFDEACAYIIAMMEKGETPVFVKEHKSFSDLYKEIYKGGK
jgi:hypothetical protein